MYEGVRETYNQNILEYPPFNFRFGKLPNFGFIETDIDLNKNNHPVVHLNYFDVKGLFLDEKQTKIKQNKTEQQV